MIKTLILLALWLVTLTGYSQKTESKGDNQKSPFVLGVVDNLYSNVLGEKRILNVYLPEGYSQSDTVRYPVIYLLDGSADEDFIHIAGLVQFNSFEWVRRVPKSIVVGIATVDRRRDFTSPTSVAGDKKQFPTSGQSQKFITFIENELQPYIRKNYKTTDSSTIIGQSFGGLLASEILLAKPYLFSNYIIVSPSIWWNIAALLKREKTALQAHTGKLEVYIACGKEGPSPGEAFRVMESDAILLAEWLKATRNTHVDVVFDYLPGENHATILHQAVNNAFVNFYTTK